MAKEKLKNIFLSASIPLKERDKKYFNSADIIAIRDSVIALATVALPNYKLIWGGHPSITPIIYYVIERLELKIQDHVTLYQSLFFEKCFPSDNNKFQNVILTKNTFDKDSSLLLMRERMFNENKFCAAIFIGGMEGVESEYKLFKKYHPKAITLPIASTGAASLILYNKLRKKNSRLATAYDYMTLFQELLTDKI